MKTLMRVINFLEKSKAFWFLLVLTVIFFLLRLPSLIEPHWYGDEGIYQVLGQAINHGRVLYSEAWDNKPPLLYLTYALFNSDQFAVRLASLFAGLGGAITFFFLSQTLFKRLSASIVATLLFAVLFATPFIEGNIANAENFMLFPILAGGLLIYHLSGQTTKQFISRNSHLLFITAGLFLGLALLYKIVALFDFAAFFLFFWIVNLPKKLSWSLITEARSKKQEFRKTFYPLLLNSCFLLLGFLAPLLLTIVWFASLGALPDFIKAAFFGNVGYVGWANKFIIPQGFLILKLLLLALVVIVVTIKRHTLSKAAIFIFLWGAFGLFNAFFSGRPYTHYVLVALPSFCLFVGLFFTIQKAKAKLGVLLLILLVGGIIFLQFSFYPLKKTFLYYQNAYLFVTGKRDVPTYQSFFDRKTPRDYETATFIKKHTLDSDTVFVWGDSAQIYALSDKLPPGKYTVAYHITQNKDTLGDMQQQIDIGKPKYIIILAEAPEFPFRLSFYSTPFTVNNVTVYERNN